MSKLDESSFLKDIYVRERECVPVRERVGGGKGRGKKQVLPASLSRESDMGPDPRTLGS